MDENTTAILAALIGVIGALAGTLLGSWMQRRATLEQVERQEKADRRLQLDADRAAACSETIRACHRVATSLHSITETRERDEVPWEEPGSERWPTLQQETQEALQALRRAMWRLRVTGPQQISEVAGEMFDVAVKYADVAYDPYAAFSESEFTTLSVHARVVGFSGRDTPLAVKSPAETHRELQEQTREFGRLRDSFIEQTQRIIGNGPETAE